jgi:DNA-binding FadR family transcriptional regulator
MVKKFPGTAARTASENVAEQIRGEIATGVLRPGNMLPSETILLDRFGVARPTMREALRILESDGLITVLRGANGGALVQEPDLVTLGRRAGLYLQMRGVHMADLMGALRVVQPGAMALAATAATPSQIAGLRSQVDIVAAADDVQAFTEAASEFLNQLMQASGNQTLAFLSNVIDQLVHAETLAYAAEHTPGVDTEMEPKYRQWCVEQYAHLVDLIEGGEGGKAEAFWRRHLHQVPEPTDSSSALRIYQDGALT